MVNVEKIQRTYPFGDIKTMTYGNGLEYGNSLDHRYFPKNIKVSATLTDVMDLA